MNARRIKAFAAPSVAIFALGACASNIAVYESPASGQRSKITFVNAAEIQEASLTTFVDGITCTGRRHIHFEGKAAIPAGDSRSVTAAAGREFVLFARLATVESEEYGVDIGITGGGPTPVIRHSVMAIGCNANISIEVEHENDYQIVISEPMSSESCSVVVSKTNKEGELVAIESTQRIARSPRNELGPFCEPLAE